MGSPPSYPKPKRLIRQASDISEASIQISSTPEAESYFRKKSELYQDRALRGELDISVSDPSSDDEDDHQRLQVLPLEDIHEEEIEIFSLSEDPILTVRDPTLLASSFENLYDRQETEEGASYANSSMNTNVAHRSSFHATFNVPERVSSFENLYQDQLQEDHHLHFQGFSLIRVINISVKPNSRDLEGFIFVFH